MTDYSINSEWIGFTSRSPEVQAKVNEIYRDFGNKDLSPSLQEFYEDMEWGQLHQSILYKGLIESQRLKRCLTASEMQALSSPPSVGIDQGFYEDDYDDTTTVPIQPNDVEGRSLAWFVARPPNPEIGRKASDILDQRILDFYVTHVNETGETYFPQLEAQLRAYYELIAD
ncbi:hypothetical protein KQ313_05170 [Synechococcus sp. CS-1325]|uniref:hypothetical protein n=1 Tax=unclassified Synechococcus TaxID=2626047 RepID=UPI0021A551DF|nr:MULTISPECIES: hypothetical protein [unclassified Synechococcus]MCT0199066.1 hypothetical protein [Synechococcus sp. CS-1325]MCT0212536.1 hypothetical protein [Synechococcus sp. CS-1326]MCT0232052.1 hypothetical protein [Synechococcus sp. CS-1327]